MDEEREREKEKEKRIGKENEGGGDEWFIYDICIILI